MTREICRLLSEDTSILKWHKVHYITTDVRLWKGMVGNMEEKDCWDKFIVSGKIEDYLKYRSIVGYAAHNRPDTADMNMGDNVERNSYAYRDGVSVVSS